MRNAFLCQVADECHETARHTAVTNATGYGGLTFVQGTVAATQPPLGLEPIEAVSRSDTICH